MPQLDNNDLIAAQAGYQDLLDTARLKQGHMSVGPAPKGSSVVALEELGKTEIRFGDPNASLVHLKPTLLKKSGLELDVIQKERLKTDNFYYMTMAVAMKPGDAVQFDQLKCELEFDAIKGNQSPIIYKMFPGPEWKTVVQWGGELSLGLGADFDWSVNLDLDKPEIQNLLNQLPSQVKAKVNNKNNYKGFITMPSFSYNLGRAEITATGEGNNFGYWDIQKPDLKQTQTVNFVIVFKTPKSVKKISMTGKTTAVTSKNWLVSHLKSILNALKESQRKTIENGIPLGDYQQWNLKLPE